MRAFSLRIYFRKPLLIFIEIRITNFTRPGFLTAEQIFSGLFFAVNGAKTFQQIVVKKSGRASEYTNSSYFYLTNFKQLCPPR